MLVHAELHRSLPERAAATFVEETSAEASLIETYARAGCSPCARFLVNTREVAAELALVTGPVETSGGLRARLLGSIASRARAPRTASAPARDASFEPSGAIARLHIADEREVIRAAEIDALEAIWPRVAEVAERSLAHLERETSFSIHFATIVRGDKTTAIAQRGLPDALADQRAIARWASFCTHTISADEPFYVEDGAREPFFRGSKMVQRYGIRAYVGAPIRSPRGVALGTVCALDFAPHRVTDSLVGAVSACATELSSLLAGLLERPSPSQGPRFPRAPRGD